jgi:hypothetical protein
MMLAIRVVICSFTVCVPELAIIELPLEDELAGGRKRPPDCKLAASTFLFRTAATPGRMRMGVLKLHDSYSN